MLKVLRILWLMSIIGSILTLFSVKIGWGELYPFTSWKLFTQPIGSTDSYEGFCIYGKKNTYNWQCLPIKKSEHFSYDDAYYLFGYLSKNLEPSHKEYLRYLAHDMYPDYDDFQLRKKKYKVSEIVQNEKLYTEELVAEF